MFDFDDDDSVPEPLGFAQVLLRELEPAIMQVNLPTFEKGGGRSVLSRSTSCKCCFVRSFPSHTEHL